MLWFVDMRFSERHWLSFDYPRQTYTQYIPLSIYDLQTWMGAPSIYVYDCSNAGIIVNSFNQFADQHEREMEQSTPPNRSSPAASSVNTANTYKNCIQLAACAAHQILPMNPQLPADLFTACLTTPIRIALKWFTLQQQSSLVPYISQNLMERYLDKWVGRNLLSQRISTQKKIIFQDTRTA